MVLAVAGIVALFLVLACGGVTVALLRNHTGDPPPRASKFTGPCEVLAATITVTAKVDGLPGVAFSADGHTVATSGQPVELWNADTGKPITSLTHRFGKLSVMAFSPDGKALAMASDDTTISDFLGFEPGGAAAGQGNLYPVVLWNVETGGPGDLYPHAAAIDGVEFSPDGSTLATIDGDDVYLWDRTGKTRGAQALPVTQPHVGGVQFSPDGKLVAVASSVGSVVVYDRATRAPVRTFDKSGDRFTGMRFSPDGVHLAVNNAGAPLKIWGITTGVAASQVDLGADDSLIDFVYSPDGRNLVTMDQTEHYRRWDASTGLQTGHVRHHCDNSTAAAARYGGFSPDGTRFTTVSQTGDGRKQVQVFTLPF